MRWAGALLTAVLIAAQPVARASGFEASYAQVKRAVAAVRAVDGGSTGLDGGGYDLACDPFEDFTGAAYGERAYASVERYSDIADRVLRFERDLPRIGYPERVWAAWLAEYERDAVAGRSARPAGGPSSGATFSDLFGSPAIGPAHSDLDGLRDLLAAYRRSHGNVLPVEIGGCEGAGERPIEVLTKPAATHVFIIPAFFYELCRVRRVDPDDTSRCAQWREVLGRVVPVSGSYRYVAKWADGTTARGILDEDAVTSGAITLHKP